MNKGMGGLELFKIEISIYSLWIVIEIQGESICLIFVIMSKFVKGIGNLYNLALIL
jgi:hypothetical protein